MSAEVATKMLEPHIKKLEDLIQSNPKMDQILIKMEEKTKVKKVYIAIIFMVLVVLWLGSGHAGQLVCNFIGFLYPAYASIKAIGKPFKKKAQSAPKPKPNKSVYSKYSKALRCTFFGE